MATKTIICDSLFTGRTVYYTCRRLDDGYVLLTADGTYAVPPAANADACLSMTESGTVLGRYTSTEARTVWNDGEYELAAYSQNGGTPDPLTDGALGSGVMIISSDAEISEAAEIANVVWDEVLTGATHNTPNSSGKRLRQAVENISYDGNIVDAAPTATSFKLSADASPVDNFYKDTPLVFLDGALAGQCRPIASYVGATRTVTLDEALTSVPVNGSGVQIRATHIHSVTQLSAAVWVNEKGNLVYASQANKRVHDKVANTITVFDASAPTPLPLKVFDTNPDLSEITPQ